MYGSIYSNHELLAELDKRVYGHTEAKRVLINAINRGKIRWHQEFSLGLKEEDLVGNKNVLLIGQSGNGKTFLIENICELCDVPFIRFDATQIKPSGSGDGLTIKQIIKEIQQHSAWLANLSHGQFTATEIMKQTVVFIDEICKLALSSDSSGNWNKNVQANLLQLIDGKTEIQGVTFLFAGAFADMLKQHKFVESKHIGFSKKPEEEKIETQWDDEIVKAGIIPELAGRIHSVVKFDTLSKDDYLNLLDDYVLPKIYKQLQYYDCYEFFLTKDEKDSIISKALKSDQGVRMLTKEAQKIAEQYEFDFEIRRESLLLEYTKEITGE